MHGGNTTHSFSMLLNKLLTAIEGEKFLNVGRTSFTVLEYVPTCF